MQAQDKSKQDLLTILGIELISKYYLLKFQYFRAMCKVHLYHVSITLGRRIQSESAFWKFLSWLPANGRLGSVAAQSTCAGLNPLPAFTEGEVRASQAMRVA